MKRTKTLLSVIVALFLAVITALSFTACTPQDDNSGGKKPEDFGITDSSSDNLSLQSIALGGTYKTEFELGDAFTSEGIVVNATYIDASISESYIKTETVDSGDYEVDSSEFLSTRVGTYSIYVSFTRTGVTRTASYFVNVKPAEPAYGGIVAELAENKEDAFELTKDATSVEVSKDILAVYSVDEKGEKSEQPLSADLYEAQLYLGSEKIENNTASKNGVYSFVATLKEDETKQDFINVYVINPVKSIKLNESDESVFEQTAGSKDEISETWQFTVTYTNGTEKTVKAGDEGLTIDIDTKTAGDDKTATVTYAEKDAKGVSHEVTCTVKYTIKANEVTGAVEYTMTYTAKTTDAAAKTGSYEVGFTGDNGEDLKNTVSATSTASSFLSKEKSTEDKTVTLADYAEIKAYSSKSITVKVGAGATNVSIKAYVSHTSSDARTVYLATATVATDESKVLDSKTIGGTGLDKNDLHVLEKSNLTEGEYYIFTDGTTVHCYQVVITYTVENSGGQQNTEPFGFNFDSLKAGDYYGSGDTANMDSIGSIEVPQNSFVQDITIVHTTSDKLTIKSSAQTITDGDNNYSVKQAFSTQGGSTLARRILKLTLDASHTYSINVWAKTSSSGRYVSYLNGESGSLINVSEAVGNGTITKHTFSANGGTLYIGGSANIDIYYIVIEVVS